MSINRATRYPGRWADATPDHPEGAFKNKTGDAAVDGSYIEKDWANDWAAFFSSLLNGTPANGTPDVVGASQLFDGLIDLIYPVGHVVFTIGNNDPGNLYPNTSWARVADGRYIMSVGQYTDANGFAADIGAGNLSVGTYYHELTIAEMPSHTHRTGHKLSAEINTGNPRADYLEDPDAGDTTNGPNSTPTGGVSGDPDSSHLNSPPGYAMYTWQRIS